MKRQYKRLRFKFRRRLSEIGRNYPVDPMSGRGPEKTTPPKRYPEGSRGLFQRLWSKQTLKFAGIAAGILFALGLAAALYVAKDLPDPNKLNSRDIAQSTQILDHTGTVKLYEIFGDKKRTLIPLEDVPMNCRWATIVKEDRDFYKHKGFVPRAITRAFFVNILRQSTEQGGSTITQQLVKNALLSPKRTFTRKFQELILSIEIEQILKKDDILKLYLNEIPYGSNAYGIQAAAQTYFGKDAKNLALEECATLAALPQAPTYYSPFGPRRKELLEQKDVILDEMAKEGYEAKVTENGKTVKKFTAYITKEQAETAKKASVTFIPPRENIKAPHFVFWVREQLVRKYGEKFVQEGGLKVLTSLDWSMQEVAEAEVSKQGAINEQRGARNAAAVVLNSNSGEVMAMVGSRDYFREDIDGNVNVALSDQQPGSSMKPMVYAALFKQADRHGRFWGPGSVMYDVLTNFGGTPPYLPRNYDGAEHGILTIRRALGNSYNIPAVKALYIAGIDTVIAALKNDFGYTSKTIDGTNCGLSLVLGGCEITLLDHTAAYGVFAAGGMKKDVIPILKVTDPRGKVLEERNPAKNSGKQVLDKQVAWLISSILSDRAARQPTFGGSLDLQGGRIAAVKTGTTDQYRDAWTMGYGDGVITGVWVGNNDNTPMNSLAGSLGAAPIWQGIMNAALKNRDPVGFPQPPGIKRETIDANYGTATGPLTTSTVTDFFLQSYKPLSPAQGGQTFEIDTVSGGRATSCTPPETRKSVTSGGLVPEIPPEDPAYSRWLAGVQRLGRIGATEPNFDDNVHQCVDTKPVVTSVSTTPPPSDGKVPKNFSVTASVTWGTNGAGKVIFSFDGSVVGEDATSPYTWSFTNVSNGSHTIDAKAVDPAFYSDNEQITVKVNSSGGGGSSSTCPPFCSVSFTAAPPARTRQTFV